MLTQMMTQRASKRAHKYCRSKKTAARTSKANTRYMRSLLIDQPELYRGSGAKRRTYYRKRKAAESANNEEESYRKSLLQDEAGRYRGCKPVATQRSYKKRAKRMVPDKQEEAYRKSLLQDEAGRYRGCEPVARKRSYKKRAKRMGPAGMKTPYNCFYAAESPRLKAENPGISQQELARLTGAAWGQLTVAARARYNVLAERDKERYSQELAVYNRMLDLPSAQAPVVPIDGPAPKQQKLSHGQAATDAQLLLCDHGCGYTGAFGDVEAHEAVCTFQSADPEPEPHEKATNGAQRPSGDANTPAAEALNTGVGIRIADLVRGAVVAVRPDENDKGPQPFWLARIDKAATRQRTTIDVTWLESTDGKTYQLDLSDPIPQASVICVVRSSLLRARLMLTTNEAESVIAKLNAQKEAGAATTDEDP
jgi:hypothetical protein